jgi:hypothetical protein
MKRIVCAFLVVLLASCGSGSPGDAGATVPSAAAPEPARRSPEPQQPDPSEPSEPSEPSAQPEPGEQPELALYPEKVITLMREERIEELAQLVRYPLKRPFPLSRLWQPADFVERYDELFDPAYRAKIIASEPGHWNHHGWRGRTYEGLWVYEDEDIIRAIARESPAEKARRLALVEQVRGVIHPSLQDFAEPLVYIETTKFKIWLDRLADGTRRYASWSRGKPLSAEPDLVLSGGELQMVGSMNNEIHTFQNGDTTYQVFPSGHPKFGWPYIEVRQGDDLLLEQPARWVDLASVVADPMPGPVTFTPTGRETLSEMVRMPGKSDIERVRGLVLAHGFVLLAHELHDSLDGDDPVEPGKHPGIRNTFIIGGCNTVEAHWIFASFTGGYWFPLPDAAELQWSDAGDSDGQKGLEVGRMESPNVEKWDTLWDEDFSVLRRKDTGEILEYRNQSRSEGGGASFTMKKMDGYTWTLEGILFAD